MRTAALTASALWLALASPASADTIWDESLDGDLSNDPNAPTLVTLEVGSNVIIGDVVTPADTRDYITFEIPSGRELSSLLLIRYEDLDSGGPGDRGYHAINLGSTSFIPSGGTADSFLGGAHLDPAPSGTDLLPVLAAAPQNGTGFTVPLGPGTYSYVVQQTGPEFTGYTLDFVVTPEPSTAGMLLLGLAALGWRARYGDAPR